MVNEKWIGKRVTCSIWNEEVEDAKINFYDGEYYICQNRYKGKMFDDKLGYEYSWNIQDGSKNAILNSNVRNLKLVVRKIEYVEQGDFIIKGTDKRKVLGRCGDVVFISFSDTDIGYKETTSIADLKYAKFKLFEEPVPEQVTITISKETYESLKEQLT